MTVTTSGYEEGGRVSPGSQPVTPHHNRTRTRSKSSGAPRRRKLEKSFSTGVMMMVWSFMMMVSRVCSELHRG